MLTILQVYFKEIYIRLNVSVWEISYRYVAYRKQTVLRTAEMQHIKRIDTFIVYILNVCIRIRRQAHGDRVQ